MAIAFLGDRYKTTFSDTPRFLLTDTKIVDFFDTLKFSLTTHSRYEYDLLNELAMSTT